MKMQSSLTFFIKNKFLSTKRIPIRKREDRQYSLTPNKKRTFLKEFFKKIFLRKRYDNF